MRVGYARVSSNDQDTAAQRERLESAGCERAFAERVSGKSTEGRKQLAECLAFIREGDQLVVTKLDRLARSMGDLIRITDELQAKRVDLVVLDQAVDTTTPAGKLMFNMIGAFAEFERALAEERRNEGIARAKSNGVKFGRPRAIGHRESEALTGLAASGAKLRDMADATGVSVPTVSRWLRANGLELKRS